jgi:hypothetical protein
MVVAQANKSLYLSINGGPFCFSDSKTSALAEFGLSLTLSLHSTVLLCSERVDGVQAGSATRGDGCGGQPAEDEPEGRQGDSPGVGCGDTVKEGMKQSVAP